MAVSHSFTGEHVEDGGGEEADADRNQHDIEHGDYPTSLSFIGVSHGAKTQVGNSRCTASAPAGVKDREALAFTGINEP